MKSHNISILNKAGFTLVEMLIVLGLVVMLGTMGLWASMDVYRGTSYRAEVNTLVSALQNARLEAMLNINAKPHGVYIGPNQYTIFEGSSYATRNQTLDRIITPSPSITITNTEVIFNQISGGTTDQSIVVSNGVRNNIITLNNEGQIDY